MSNSSLWHKCQIWHKSSHKLTTQTQSNANCCHAWTNTMHWMNVFVFLKKKPPLPYLVTSPFCPFSDNLSINPVSKAVNLYNSNSIDQNVASLHYIFLGVSFHTFNGDNKFLSVSQEDFSDSICQNSALLGGLIRIMSMRGMKRYEGRSMKYVTSWLPICLPAAGIEKPAFPIFEWKKVWKNDDIYDGGGKVNSLPIFPKKRCRRLSC